MEQPVESKHMEDMEATVVESTLNEMNTPSLLILNDDCLLEIAKHLNLYDTIDLSKTCHRLKGLATTFMFKKFSQLTIDSEMFSDDGGEELIHEVLSHIGSHVVKLKCSFGQLKLKYFWSIVNKTCKQLKHIEIDYWVERSPQNFQQFTCLRNVESVDLTFCRFHSSSNFLSTFRSLTRFSSYNSVDDLAMLLRNNRNLTSCQFVPVFRIQCPKDSDDSDEEQMDFRCFEMVPKLKELSIDLPHADGFSVLAKMRLENLELWCKGRHINQLLIHLDEHECMEKLTLRDIKLNAQSMNILKSKFTKLRSLTIEYGKNYSDRHDAFSTLPIGWPENLTELILQGVSISFDMFLATLRYFKRLTMFDLRRSSGVNQSDEKKFYNINFMQPQILAATRYQHKLTVVLPMVIHGSGERSSEVF